MAPKYKGKLFYAQEMEGLRRDFAVWNEVRRQSKTPFFLLYKDFKDLFLKNLSGGAVKLYLYYGFHVNNLTGECWVSSETAAEFFEVDIRTIKKWVKELEEEGLIERIQSGYKRVANTFLRPYKKKIVDSKE